MFRMVKTLALLIGSLMLGAEAWGQSRDTPTDVTYSRDVAPILRDKCEECHRVGSIAPMPLSTFEQARPWARAIKSKVQQRQMPPWHINKDVGVRDFANDVSLTDSQIATIVKWVDSGAPEGRPGDAPPPREWDNNNAWKAAALLGEPDLVITSDPYTMPAQHQDVWWRPESRLDLPKERWVKAVEMRPRTLQGRRIMHHAVAYLDQDDTDTSGVYGSATEDRRGMLMEWAIGKNYDLFRPNTGKLLKPGAAISWDIHIHAVGEEITDSMQIAVWFYPEDAKPKYRTYLTRFEARNEQPLDIPPNSRVVTEGFTRLDRPARLESVQPHMHLRGVAMSVEAILPDGTRQMISYVDRFTFNWMTNYIYADRAAPVVPTGTVIHVKAWYDNSTANKNGIDPQQWVGFGDRTVDEMGHAWMNVTYLTESDYQSYLIESGRGR